jgi:hypothetical protein
VFVWTDNGYAPARTRLHSYTHNHLRLEEGWRSCPCCYWVCLCACVGEKADWDFDFVCVEHLVEFDGPSDLGHGTNLKNPNTAWKCCGEIWAPIVAEKQSVLAVQSLAVDLTVHPNTVQGRAPQTPDAACSGVSVILRQATDGPMVYHETWSQFRCGDVRE